MNTAVVSDRKWNQRGSDPTGALAHTQLMTELRASEQLLVSIVNNISEGVFRTGPEHELIFANPAYLSLSGYDSLEELQRTARENLYAVPAARARLLELLAQHGEFRNEEIEYVRRDGKRWWGLTSTVAIRDATTGAVLYHVGSVKDISRRKATEAELLKLNVTLERRVAERTAEVAASEARLRTLVDHAPEAIVVFDGESGRFLSGNAHACRLYGRCPEELTELTPADVSPKRQADGRPSIIVAREWMDEALAGGAPVFEWIHRHASGRLIPTEVRLVRLPSEGKPLLRASIIDNSERKRREKIQQATYEISEAAHTADDLDGLFAQIHSIVKTLMPAENLYIALINPGGQTIGFPYMVDENGQGTTPLPLGKGFTGHVVRTGKTLLAGPHNAAIPGETVDAVVDGGQTVVASCCTKSAAVWLGAPLSIRGAAFGVIAVQDYHNPHAYGEEEKQILTFVAGQIALAIERKRTEQALRESEEKFRALFAASSQGVMLHDENQYLEVNPAAARILGYRTQEEIIGLHPRDTSPPLQPNGERSDSLAARQIAECMSKGSARFEWVARHAAGHDILLEVMLTRIEWRGRQVIQAVIQDISERKRAEAELLKALAREKELSGLKSSFVSMVSHEFRTPLGIIMSSAEILEDYFEELAPEDRKNQLQSIRKNSRRMADLMEEVLVLSRFEAGKMILQPVRLDVKRFCERVVDEVLSATNRVSPIALAMPDAIGEAAADERLLGHIFINLLTNAVKYSPPGVPVEFNVAREDGAIICRVRDSGIGIPEADRPWLFTAFHRGRNVGQRPGSGLGLVIVKRCVELHGGAISILSQPGQGTTVMVRLPGCSLAPSH